jgi:ribosome maturation factor RimP
LENKKRPGISTGIRKMADEIQDQLGLTVVRTEFVREFGRRILRVIINKEGGVMLSDCEAFSRALSAKLDEEDLIKEKYFLEVASPGIDSEEQGG